MCIIYTLISIMYHFPDQFSNLTMPSQRQLVFHAVFQIHAPFLMGEVKNLLFIRCCTDIYICTFSVYPNICTFCMYNLRRQQVYKDLFCSVFVLFENSRQSLFIIPLDIFGFPPVRSDRKHLLLSMETAQSLFNKNKSVQMLRLQFTSSTTQLLIK